ncbi:unnamed protein product [Kuraishia capsulata CBS 1993]|uniref:Uncharacterized protein n=1 Tax=Kuraishia capsulata CBS 1993 TaxID=1382522 RepID=W6MFA4_9ASCO|nr:uncharacterized protein KUCA_T00000381001 [Kuraishia capsulata CBS 1993]CDK24419.1 unnamed protein product [Kuraishia capsulata CBS 1993]
MPELEFFLKKLKNALQLPAPTAQAPLAELLSLDPQKHHIPRLQAELQNVTSEKLSDDIDALKLFDNGWPGLEQAVLTYLVFVRDFNPWSTLDSIDLMIKYFSDLAVAMGNIEFSKYLLSTLAQTTAMIVPLTKTVDLKLMLVNKRKMDFPRLSHVSGILLKAMNNLRADTDIALPSHRDKQTLLILLSAKLCSTYFFIGSPMLCNNIFSNISTLKLNSSYIPRAQLLRYRFLVGKYHFTQSSMLNAFHHFSWCLENCHTNASPAIFVTLLKYLIPCGILVGRILNMEFLKKLNQFKLNGLGHELIVLYEPLIRHFRNGDIYNFTILLKKNESFFRKTGILLPLIQRSRILLLRNLTLKVYRLNPGKTIAMAKINVALNLSLQPEQAARNFGAGYSYYMYDADGGVDDSFVENVLVALTDQNLVKGKVAPVSKSVVVAKTDTFPNVYELYKVKYPLDPKDGWLDSK